MVERCEDTTPHHTHTWRPLNGRGEPGRPHWCPGKTEAT